MSLLFAVFITKIKFSGFSLGSLVISHYWLFQERSIINLIYHILPASCGFYLQRSPSHFLADSPSIVNSSRSVRGAYYCLASSMLLIAASTGPLRWHLFCHRLSPAIFIFNPDWLAADGTPTPSVCDNRFDAMILALPLLRLPILFISSSLYLFLISQLQNSSPIPYQLFLLDAEWMLPK